MGESCKTFSDDSKSRQTRADVTRPLDRHLRFVAEASGTLPGSQGRTKEVCHWEAGLVDIGLSSELASPPLALFAVEPLQMKERNSEMPSPDALTDRHRESHGADAVSPEDKEVWDLTLAGIRTADHRQRVRRTENTMRAADITDACDRLRLLSKLKSPSTNAAKAVRSTVCNSDFLTVTGPAPSKSDCLKCSQFCSLGHRWYNGTTSQFLAQSQKVLHTHRHCVKKTFTHVDNLVKTRRNNLVKTRLSAQIWDDVAFGHCAQQICQPFVSEMFLCRLKLPRKRHASMHPVVPQSPTVYSCKLNDCCANLDGGENSNGSTSRDGNSLSEKRRYLRCHSAQCCRCKHGQSVRMAFPIPPYVGRGDKSAHRVCRSSPLLFEARVEDGEKIHQHIETREGDSEGCSDSDASLHRHKHKFQPKSKKKQKATGRTAHRVDQDPPQVCESLLEPGRRVNSLSMEASSEGCGSSNAGVRLPHREFHSKLDDSQKDGSAESVGNPDPDLRTGIVHGIPADRPTGTGESPDPAENARGVMSDGFLFQFDANPHLTLSLVSVVTSIMAEDSLDLSVADVVADQLICLRTWSATAPEQASEDLELDHSRPSIPNDRSPLSEQTTVLRTMEAPLAGADSLNEREANREVMGRVGTPREGEGPQQSSYGVHDTRGHPEQMRNGPTTHFQQRNSLNQMNRARGLQEVHLPLTDQPCKPLCKKSERSTPGLPQLTLERLPDAKVPGYDSVSDSSFSVADRKFSSKFLSEPSSNSESPAWTYPWSEDVTHLGSMEHTQMGDCTQGTLLKMQKASGVFANQERVLCDDHGILSTARFCVDSRRAVDFTSTNPTLAAFEQQQCESSVEGVYKAAGETRTSSYIINKASNPPKHETKGIRSGRSGLETCVLDSESKLPHLTKKPVLKEHRKKLDTGSNDTDAPSDGGSLSRNDTRKCENHGTVEAPLQSTSGGHSNAVELVRTPEQSGKKRKKNSVDKFRSFFNMHKKKKMNCVAPFCEPQDAVSVVEDVLLEVMQGMFDLIEERAGGPGSVESALGAHFLGPGSGLRLGLKRGRQSTPTCAPLNPGRQCELHQQRHARLLERSSAWPIRSPCFLSRSGNVEVKAGDDQGQRARVPEDAHTNDGSLELGPCERECTPRPPPAMSLSLSDIPLETDLKPPKEMMTSPAGSRRPRHSCSDIHLVGQAKNPEESTQPTPWSRRLKSLAYFDIPLLGGLRDTAELVQPRSQCADLSCDFPTRGRGKDTAELMQPRSQLVDLSCYIPTRGRGKDTAELTQVPRPQRPTPTSGTDALLRGRKEDTEVSPTNTVSDVQKYVARITHQSEQALKHPGALASETESFSEESRPGEGRRAYRAEQSLLSSEGTAIPPEDETVSKASQEDSAHSAQNCCNTTGVLAAHDYVSEVAHDYVSEVSALFETTVDVLGTVGSQGEWISEVSDGDAHQKTPKGNLAGVTEQSELKRLPESRSLTADLCPFTCGRGFFLSSILSKSGLVQSLSDTALINTHVTSSVDHDRNGNSDFNCTFVFYAELLKSHRTMKISTVSWICSLMLRAFQAELIERRWKENVQRQASSSDTSVGEKLRSLHTKSNNNSRSGSAYSGVVGFQETLATMAEALEKGFGGTETIGSVKAETPAAVGHLPEALQRSSTNTSMKATQGASELEGVSKTSVPDYEELNDMATGPYSNNYLQGIIGSPGITIKQLLEIKKTVSDLEQCTNLFLWKTADTKNDDTDHEDSSLDPHLPKHGSKNSMFSFIPQNSSQSQFDITCLPYRISFADQLSNRIKHQSRSLKRFSDRLKIRSVSLEHLSNMVRPRSRSLSPKWRPSSSSDESPESRNRDRESASSSTLRPNNDSRLGASGEAEHELYNQSSTTITRSIDDSASSCISSSDDFQLEDEETRRMQESLEMEDFVSLERAFLEEEEKQLRENMSLCTQLSYDAALVELPFSYNWPMESIPEEDEEFVDVHDTMQSCTKTGLNLSVRASEKFNRSSTSVADDVSFKKSKDFAAEFYSFDDWDASFSDTYVPAGTGRVSETATCSHGKSLHVCRGRQSLTDGRRDVAFAPPVPATVPVSMSAPQIVLPASHVGTVRTSLGDSPGPVPKNTIIAKPKLKFCKAVDENAVSTEARRASPPSSTGLSKQERATGGQVSSVEAKAVQSLVEALNAAPSSTERSCVCFSSQNTHSPSSAVLAATPVSLGANSHQKQTQSLFKFPDITSHSMGTNILSHFLHETCKKDTTDSTYVDRAVSHSSAGLVSKSLLLTPRQESEILADSVNATYGKKVPTPRPRRRSPASDVSGLENAASTISRVSSQSAESKARETCYNREACEMGKTQSVLFPAKRRIPTVFRDHSTQDDKSQTSNPSAADVNAATDSFFSKQFTESNFRETSRSRQPGETVRTPSVSPSVKSRIPLKSWDHSPQEDSSQTLEPPAIVDRASAPPTASNAARQTLLPAPRRKLPVRGAPVEDVSTPQAANKIGASPYTAQPSSPRRSGTDIAYRAAETRGTFPSNTVPKRILSYRARMPGVVTSRFSASAAAPASSALSPRLCTPHQVLPVPLARKKFALANTCGNTQFLAAQAPNESGAVLLQPRKALSARIASQAAKLQKFCISDESVAAGYIVRTKPSTSTQLRSPDCLSQEQLLPAYRTRWRTNKLDIRSMVAATSMSTSTEDGDGVCPDLEKPELLSTPGSHVSPLAQNPVNTIAASIPAPPPDPQGSTAGVRPTPRARRSQMSGARVSPTHAEVPAVAQDVGNDAAHEDCAGGSQQLDRSDSCTRRVACDQSEASAWWWGSGSPVASSAGLLDSRVKTAMSPVSNDFTLSGGIAEVGELAENTVEREHGLAGPHTWLGRNNSKSWNSLPTKWNMPENVRACRSLSDTSSVEHVCLHRQLLTMISEVLSSDTQSNTCDSVDDDLETSSSFSHGNLQPEFGATYNDVGQAKEHEHCAERGTSGILKYPHRDVRNVADQPSGSSSHHASVSFTTVGESQSDVSCESFQSSQSGGSESNSYRSCESWSPTATCIAPENSPPQPVQYAFQESVIPDIWYGTSQFGSYQCDGIVPDGMVSTSSSLSYSSSSSYPSGSHSAHNSS